MCINFIVLVLLNLSLYTSGKEFESLGSYSRGSNLILNRVKRLNGYKGLDDSESRKIESQCSPSNLSPQANTIIRSSASIENGARHLNIHSGVKSSRACFNLCCQALTCDTSIYEDKADRRCYLFDCHGRCEFKTHRDYIVWDIERVVVAPPAEEEELAHLHNDDDDTNNHDNSNEKDANVHQVSAPKNYKNDGDDSMSQSNANPPTPTQKSKAVYVAPHTAGLAEYCASDVSCEDPNAACFDGACHCKSSFYNKDHLCRKVCRESEFECLALGTLGRGPECIPKSQMCDSHPQCADRSDEFNCNTQASNSDTAWNNVASSAWMGGQDQDSNRNSNAMNNRQRVEGTQAVLQEGQNQQELPAYDPLANYDISTPPEDQEVSHRNALPGIMMHHKGNANIGNSLNPPSPSVRPKPVVAQPAKPTMDNRNQLPRKNNQPFVGPIRNTNPNTAYSQPAANVNTYQNTNDKVRNNNNENNAFRGSSQNVVPENINEDTKSRNYPNTGREGESPQPMNSQNFQNHDRNNPKVSPQHQKPQNMAYSESGPFRELPVQQERNQEIKTKEQQKTQRLSSPTRLSQYTGSSNTNSATHKSDVSNINDRNKPALRPNAPQRIPGRMKSPVSTLPKLPSSLSQPQHKSIHQSGKIDPYASQQSSVLSSKTKETSRIRPDVRPDYSSSSLLSSSSSSRQPSHQGWLDSNPYLSYGSGSQRQKQQQLQPPRNGQYYDPSQYFPQYNSDSIDPLSPSLLGDAGSQDDFSQFGGSYIDRQKPLNRLPYPVNSGNLGYVGYPDSSYNTQYNPSSRYNYGGDYGTNNYQDPEFYPSARNSKGYQPGGLYEDTQSNSHLASSGGDKNKGTYQSGNKLNTTEDGKFSPQETKSQSVPSEKDTEPKTAPSDTKTKESSSSHESAGGTAKNKTKSDASTNNVKSDLTHSTTTTKKPHSSLSHNKVYLTQEKVIIASSTSEAEGPIIALSLGLAFTLILIVLLGCRLRNMKHRLRKGRPLNSNEADYLINGMYL